jgi:Flp pilus assembly protein TadG
MVEFALVAPMLFLVLLGIIEAGRFVLNMEALNNATREGARYAIVHGALSADPQGPMPQGQPNPGGVAAVAGEDIKAAVRRAAISISGSGDLVVPTPRWTLEGSQVLPDSPTDTNSTDGHNSRGNYVTVFADYSYQPIIKMVFGIDLIPSITLSAESTLVINT